jgi:diguanylate cyclase (GGDEF)-like protein
MTDFPHQPAASSTPGSDDGDIFDIAPVSLWLEDYSGVQRQLQEWRAQGVSDLRTFLLADLTHVERCSGQIKVIKVNRKTLALYEAQSSEQLVTSLALVFRDDMLESHVDELVQLWNGQSGFTSNAVNYTLTGKRLDIQLNATVLPGYESGWERVLVAIEDVTPREAARRSMDRSESYARALFEHSPVSLWVEDFSAIRLLLEEVRAQGIEDFRVFTDVHPEFIDRCMEAIRVIDVNRQTLWMFAAPDKATLLRQTDAVFRDEMRQHFREQLVELWNGKLFQQREVVNYTLAGDKLHVYLQFSVLPGHEQDWSKVQVALIDITARKKAEAYLEYLGKHDVLTKLKNRAFHVDELNRLERRQPFPVTVIVADLNNLKKINDELGHAAGDALLRRIGEVLAEAVDAPCYAARLGGDEFSILLPNTDERNGAVVVERIQKLIELNNQFYSGVTLSLSIGAATTEPGERLESVVQRADSNMYADKRRYYQAGEVQDRRSS